MNKTVVEHTLIKGKRGERTKERMERESPRERERESVLSPFSSSLPRPFPPLDTWPNTIYAAFHDMTHDVMGFSSEVEGVREVRGRVVGLS